MDYSMLIFGTACVAVGWCVGFTAGFINGKNRVYEWLRAINDHSNGKLDQLVDSFRRTIGGKNG